MDDAQTPRYLVRILLVGVGRLSSCGGFLIRCVQEKPDITMPELAAELEARHGLEADPASLSRFLCKAGLTYKKNPSGRGARTLRRRQAPQRLDP